MNRVLHLDDAQSAQRKRSPWGWLVLGLIIPGCIIDNDHKCGPDEVPVGKYLCTCPEGTAFTPTGCVPCGDHEVSSPTGCICEPGYARSSPVDACAEIPAGLGNACTADGDCPSPFHCHVGPAVSYCTLLDCSDTAPCPGNFICDTTGAAPFCKGPPVGEGKACMTNADCAGTEATFCDLGGQCRVQDCTLAPDSCFPGIGTACCNLSSFNLPNVCLQEGVCLSN